MSSTWVIMSDLKEAWAALESHWKIIPKDARITGDASYGFMRWTLAPFFRMIFRVKIKGIGNVPKSGPTILAANHLSHVDPLVVILASRRRTHYLAKDGHFRNAALRTFMRATGQIETNRKLVALKHFLVLQWSFMQIEHWVYSLKALAQRRPKHHSYFREKLVLLDWQHHIQTSLLYLSD